MRIVTRAAGQSMEMTNTFSGKRVGACTAASEVAQQPQVLDSVTLASDARDAPVQSLRAAITVVGLAPSA